MDVLFVTDSHSLPSYDNNRFADLGAWVRENMRRGDAIIHGGDHFDVPSLCSHSSMKDREGARYLDDVEWGVRGLDLFNRASGWAGRKEYCGGNHGPGRISTAVGANPYLEGVISTNDLRLDELGWNYTPFKEFLEVEGFVVSHYFPSGLMGRPSGGANPAQAVLKKHHVSALFGHCHLFSVATDVLPTGRRINSLSGGCFVHPAYKEGWCANTRHLWWEGFTVLRNVNNGDASIEFIRTQDIAGMGKRFYKTPSTFDFGARARTAPPVKPATPKRGARRLSDDDVRYIRRSAETATALSKRFGMTPSTISKVRLGNRYRDVV